MNLPSSQNNVIPSSTQILIHNLAELGYLYSRVESFVRDRESATRVGMIEQSLCHYLQAQLTEYYRLIAVLETQLAAKQQDESVESLGHHEIGLTLRRLDVWVNEWKLRLRMMSVCVEGARGWLISYGCCFVLKIIDKIHMAGPS
jgi:gamma-tubulin complex component 3